AQTLLHGGAPHLGLEALSELVVPPMLIVVVPVTLPPIATLPRSAWTLTAPRPTKKVTATKTASAIPAMAAESLSQRGTPSSTLTWTKVGLSAGPACWLLGGPPGVFSEAGCRPRAPGLFTPFVVRC